MRAVLLASVVALTAGSGCGDDDAPGPADGGLLDGSTDASASAITPPAPPMPPVLAPCAAGWRELTDEWGVTTCEPWPETGRATTCADDEAHFTGEPGCARVGTACPTSGDFPEDLPPGRAVVYVLAGAPAGGDGSLARPFARIADAIATARSTGGVVALGRGRYAEQVALAGGVTLWGACVADTILAPTTGASGTLTIGVTAGQTGEARNLSVEAGVGAGAGALGAGAELALEGVVIRGSPIYGLYVSRTAVLRGHDLVVRDTEPGPSGDLGNGVAAFGGGTAELSRVVLERTRRSAVVAIDADTRVSIDGLAIDSVLPRRDTSTAGTGLIAEHGGALDVRHAVVEDTRVYGVWARDSGSVISLADSVIRGVAGAASDSTFGVGIGADAAAVVTVQRTSIARTREIGILVLGADVSIEDVVIRDVLGSDATSELGRGIEIERGGTSVLRRVDVGRVRDAGLVVDAASLTASDLAVHDVESTAGMGVGGRGMNLQDVLAATLDRARIERCREVALTIVGPASDVRARDLLVRDSTGRQIDGLGGRGVVVALGAHALLERTRIERCRDVGLLSVEADAFIDATDVVVRDVQPQQCATPDCVGFGHGIAATRGGALSATRFEVTGAAACGVMVAQDGALDLSDGAVRECAIGACVQVDGYDTARLSTSVAYLDNGSPLSSTTLPVPAADVGLGTP